MRLVLTIEGMHCEQCTKRVRDSILAITGKEATVTEGQAVFEWNSLDIVEDLRTLLNDYGYSIVEVETFEKN